MLRYMKLHEYFIEYEKETVTNHPDFTNPLRQVDRNKKIVTATHTQAAIDFLLLEMPGVTIINIHKI